MGWPSENRWNPVLPVKVLFMVRILYRGWS